MDDNTNNSAYVVHLRVEHQRLHEVIRHINQDWLDLDQVSPKIGIERITRDVLELRKELKRHFQEEEEGACLEEVVSLFPSLAAEADRIERQQAPLLGRLDEIISHLQALQVDVNATDDLCREIKQFTAFLQEHEKAENELLENAFGIQVE